MVHVPLQPILVLPVYRGGRKFARALASVRAAEPYFRRIVISLNSPNGSPDEATIRDYREQGPTKIEVVQTGCELPWMEHQYFWLGELERSGEKGDSWICWFAHDDQIRVRGIAELVRTDGSWPLTPGTCYLGPWGMRYDPVDGLYDGPPDAPIESWTSFPLEGPTSLPTARWIADQLIQPTYINMSGCVTQLRSFQQLRAFPIRKPGGMRIEMATAAAPANTTVAEFPTPIVITHTSKQSDRTQYAKVARQDDRHMAAWLANYILQHPRAAAPTAQAVTSVLGAHLGSRIKGTPLPAEDWRYRETVES